jgi:aminocarboxymuconate-semialdehyde decarboxylase
MPTIDVHAHILPRSAALAYEKGRDWFGTTLTRNADGTTGLQTGARKSTLSAMPEYWQPHADRIRSMDEDGIDMQVLSLNPQFFRDSLDAAVAIECARVVNEEIAETVDDRPDRFAGVAALPLQDSEAAVRELERAMGPLKLRGMIVPSHVDGVNWDDPSLFPILEAAERLGAFILLHPLNTRIREPMPRHHLINLIGNPLETTIAAASLILGGVLDRLPDLKICLSHAGGYIPFAVGRFDHAYGLRDDVRQNAELPPSRYLRRFHYDCISHSDAGLQQVMDLVGADRIVIGTDFPADMGLRYPVKWLEDRTYLTAAQLGLITGGNAERLVFGATAHAL